jgi:hypothetical protein
MAKGEVLKEICDEGVRFAARGATVAFSVSPSRQDSPREASSAYLGKGSGAEVDRAKTRKGIAGSKWAASTDARKSLKMER